MDYSAWTRNGYITAADAALATGVPAPTVHRWMRKGRLPYALQGRRHFVKVDDLVVFVRTTWTDPAVSELVIDAIRKTHREAGKRKR